MALAIFGVLFYLNYLGYKPTLLTIIIAAFAASSMIKFAEIHRIKDWWAVTENSIVQSTGIFNKNVREVDFSSISDIDLDKSFFKRFLNYGHINVRLFLNETSIKIENINRPEEFMEELQRIMSNSRSKKRGISKI